jgi:VanZ family protein
VTGGDAGTAPVAAARVRAFRPQLRYPWAWFAAGLVLAAAITVTSLMPASELPAIGMSDKLEHLLAYVALGFWFASLISRRDYLFLALALLAFGGAIEIAQGWMALGRQADLADLLADAIGSVIGIAIAMTPLGRWASALEGRITGRRG